MRLKIIGTKKEYHAALAETKRLMLLNPAPDTPDADLLGVLITLVESYEQRNFELTKTDPVDVLTFVMEQRGLERNDLIPFLGSRVKVWEILSGRRTLSKSMIIALHEGLGIPYELLLVNGINGNHSKVIKPVGKRMNGFRTVRVRNGV